jgi:hypothetical protein
MNIVFGVLLALVTFAYCTKDKPKVETKVIINEISPKARETLKLMNASMDRILVLAKQREYVNKLRIELKHR